MSEMETDATQVEQERKFTFLPLRVWPVFLLLALMIVARYVPGLVQDGPDFLWVVAAFGPALCGMGILLWWLTLSRARWYERLLGLVGLVAMGPLAFLAIDKSMQGPPFTVITFPMGFAAFGIGAILFRKVLSVRRTVLTLFLALLGFGFSAALRADGMWGNYAFQTYWRWNESAEQKLLASKSKSTSTDSAKPNVDKKIMQAEWPEFRGPDRMAIQRGTKFASNWTGKQPEQVWKIAVGPSWSSFVVAGDLLFTQEQRGPMEAVVCYESSSGNEVWAQQVEGRFDDPLGGPGPRATPTLADDRLFATGANGDVLCLKPATGDVIWRQNLQTLASRKPPMWGFCSSPLVTNELVIVHAGGDGDKGIFAFEVATGNVKWSCPSGDHTYSSPQLCKVRDRSYVVMMTNRGMELIDPVSGKVLLDYTYELPGYRSLQPFSFGEDSIIMPTGLSEGTRRVELSLDGDAITAKEVWSSRYMKPDFNDGVVYKDHFYGFNGAIFACISLVDGSSQWKGGRYGKGQVLLLEDSGLLLVASEEGDVVLVEATPDEHRELAKFHAIDGKTWNHPVVVGDKLYIRNAEQAACYRLPIAN